MELTQQELTIHINDRVSFYDQTNKGMTHFSGIVKGVVCGDDPTVRVDVNQFLTYTIPAKSLHSVNGLFISLNNFRDNILIRVGV